MKKEELFEQMKSKTNDKKIVNVLTGKPTIKEQNGPNCLMYAVDAARVHLENVFPDDFSDYQYLPRKCDRQTSLGLFAKRSLRSYRKEVGAPGVGGVLSVKAAQKLLEIDECDSKEIRLRDYFHFMKVITRAIDQNYPVLVPFTLGSQYHPGVVDKSDRVHWCVVIGYDENSIKLLVMQYGSYFKFDAFRLFQSNINSKKYPGTFWHKKDGEWNKVSKEEYEKEDAVYDKRYIYPEQELDDFGGKIIVAMPKGHELDLYQKKEQSHSMLY